MLHTTFKGVIASLGLLLCATSHAGLITFDDAMPSIYGDSESAMVDSTFNVTARSLGLIGDSMSCFVAQCPSGNDTQAWYALNDGGFDLSRFDNGAMRLWGFDVSFLAPFPMYAPEVLLGQLLVTAYSNTGAMLNSWAFELPTQNVDGNFYFAHINTSDLNVVGHVFRFSSCTYDFSGQCLSPNDNLNQFVMDNIHVPSGETLGLFSLGLAGLMFMRRRQK